MWITAVLVKFELAKCADVYIKVRDFVETLGYLFCGLRFMFINKGIKQSSTLTHEGLKQTLSSSTRKKKKNVHINPPSRAERESYVG